MPDPPAATADVSAESVRQSSRELVRELDAIQDFYLESGCSLPQCHLLFELDQQPHQNVAELAETLLVDKSSASRGLKSLLEAGHLRQVETTGDQRQKRFELTARGKRQLTHTLQLAQQQVSNALATLTQDEQSQVLQGIRLYSKALRQSRLQAAYQIRPIQKKDNAAMARVIREVMTEFQAVGPGYSIEDAEVDDMWSHYRDPDSCYLVIVQDGRVLGGGGVAPLHGGPPGTCELRKMFFLPTLRGLGMGRKLLLQLLDEARERGFTQCYLETLQRMWAAVALYEKCGFRKRDGALGNTGHCRCDIWYHRDL